MSLYNGLGQEVFKTKKATINVSNYVNGMYFLKVETDQVIGVKKVFIK